MTQEKENWEERFTKLYSQRSTTVSFEGVLRSFISQLLTTERENIENDILRRSGGIEAVGARAFKEGRQQVLTQLREYVEINVKPNTEPMDGYNYQRGVWDTVKDILSEIDKLAKEGI